MSANFADGCKKTLRRFVGVRNQDEIDRTHVYCIKSFLKTKKSTDRLIKGHMFLVHMIVCDYESLNPFEIAISYFSLAKGNSESVTFHSVFRGETDVNCSRQPTKEEIFEFFAEIEMYIAKHCEHYLKYIPLFARPDVVRLIQLVLKKHEFPIFERIRIYDCAILIKVLHDQGLPEDGGHSCNLQEIRDNLVQNCPDSNNKFVCGFHYAMNKSELCSLAIVDIISAVICEHCCPVFEIRVKRGIHISHPRNVNCDTSKEKEQVSDNDSCKKTKKQTVNKRVFHNSNIANKQNIQIKQSPYKKCGDKSTSNGYYYKYFSNRNIRLEEELLGIANSESTDSAQMYLIEPATITKVVNEVKTVNNNVPNNVDPPNTTVCNIQQQNDSEVFDLLKYPLNFDNGPVALKPINVNDQLQNFFPQEEHQQFDCDIFQEYKLFPVTTDIAVNNYGLPNNTEEAIIPKLIGPPSKETEKQETDDDLATTIDVGFFKLHFIKCESRAHFWFKQSGSVVVPYGTDFHRKLHNLNLTGDFTIENYNKICTEYNETILKE